MKKYNIYNKVKTLAVAAVLASSGAAVTSSCSDFLEVEPRDIITQEKFWDEKGDVEAIIAGIYSSMQNNGILSRMMIWGEFRSENVYLYGTEIKEDVNLERLLNEKIQDDNGYAIWTEFYNIINRCNIVIENAPQVRAKDPSYLQSQLDAHIAEVTAIRSLCYFYLIRTFKDVPYSETAYVSDDQQLDLPATPFNQVLDKLIASLEGIQNDVLLAYSASNKGQYGDYNTGRITRAAVHAMLADMYLWRQNYTQSVRYADLVIDEMRRRAWENKKTDVDSLTFGYPLIPSRYGSDNSNTYGNAFTQIFVNGNSEESIFELNFIKNSDRQFLSNVPALFFFGAGNGQGAKAPWTTCSDVLATDVPSKSYKVFNNQCDGRAYENMIWSSDKSTATHVNKYTTSYSSQIRNLAQLSGSTLNVTIGYGAPYEYYSEGGKDHSLNRSNFIIYRLTDVMLIKAEALACQMSGTMVTDPDTGQDVLSPEDQALRDEAFQLVSAVNTRSLYVQKEQYDQYKLSVEACGTRGTMIDMVMDERNRELMFEGKRYFDLVRYSLREGNTKYLRDHVKQKNTRMASIIDSKLTKMDAIFWPYYRNEVVLNKNLRQNSAY